MASISSLKSSSFLSIFFPMLISFMSFRLMLQTDLMMLAPLGEVALAAFGVPMKVMWIDMIVALALIPVASVYVSSTVSI